jgi:PleD family two-component response regulator
MNAYGRLEIATDITRRKQMELELQEAHQQARAAALEDELTGLQNRADRALYQSKDQGRGRVSTCSD